MVNKFDIGIVQFYISHTCNIACPGCLSFNNFNISGHDLFKDYEKQATEWSHILRPADMSIIGGEPLANPDINAWALGIRNLFPDCQDFKICSNGLLVSKHQHNILNWWENNIILEISAHTPNQFSKIQQDLSQITSAIDVVVCDRKTVRKHADVPRYYLDDYSVFYVYKGRVVSMIAQEYQFSNWGIKKFSNGELEFFESDARRAHDNCPFYDCHYIYRGELYKCGTIVGAKELVKKYNVKPDQARLVNKYKPLKYDDPELLNKLETFTDTHIRQCSLCPENSDIITIQDSDVKKVKTGYKQ